jgi:hypothetical protein
MLFPTIWLDVFIETRVRRAAARTKTIYDIQKSTGLHWSVSNMEEIASNIDFEEVTYVLNVLGSELAWDELALSVLMRIQEQILASHGHLTRTSQIHSSTDSCQLDLEYADVVATRLAQSKDILCGLQGKTKYNAQQVGMQDRAVSMRT